MNRTTLLIAAISAGIIACAGCSKGGSPVGPDLRPATQAPAVNVPQTHLWGYYDVYVDLPSKTMTAVPNREVMFALNIVYFLNSKPADLKFIINGTPASAQNIDIDVDFKITHPIAGKPQYNGYDVRGIFIGNGSRVMAYNSDLKYAAHFMPPGPDQEMYDYGDIGGDPHPGMVGNPDGYTRWWNPSEFTTPGLFGYTKGIYASKNYTGTATLNPYKYFADGMNAGDSAWSYLSSKTPLMAVFSSGQTNVRNYYLRFPTPSPGIKFSYAIDANWISPTIHPAHAPEACGISVSIKPDLYYVSSSNKGGNLILDMSLPTNFGPPPSTIFIESDVISSPHQMTSGSSEMIPVGGGSGYSTYHVEIPGDNITGNSSTIKHEFWVIPQYDGFNYNNNAGVPNNAGDDRLAAFFRHDIFVNPFSYGNEPPVCDLQVTTPMPHVGGGHIYFDASGSSDPDNNPLTFAWDFNGDGTFGGAGDSIDGGTPDKPMHHYTADYVGNVYVKVANKKYSTTCSVDVDITVLRSINVVGAPNIDLGDGLVYKDIACNPSDDSVAVNFDKTNVWKKFTINYTVSEINYTPYSWMSNWDGNENFLFFGGSMLFNGNFPVWTWTDWSGTASIGDSFAYDCPGIIDSANGQGTGSVFALYDDQPNSQALILDSSGVNLQSILYTWPVPWYGGEGNTGVIMANLRAIDMPLHTSGPLEVYTLEKIPSESTGEVEKWSGPTPTFETSFGKGLFYDPLDISVDSLDNVYVLDINSDGAPVIWAYDSTGTLIGTSDPIPTSDISGTPLRLDVSLNPNPNEIHVLHSQGVTKFVMN